MPANPHSYSGRALSRYRTFHIANFFYDIHSVEDLKIAFARAKEVGKADDIFILGAGSNVFFKKTNIESFVIKNSLEPEIKRLDGDRYQISSSVEMLSLLKFLYSESRDGPYYLASAPCQIGGAIAMNAGSGPKDKLSISDFLESVTFFRDGKIESLGKDKIAFTYRRSDFLDSPTTFIISGIFRFPKKHFDVNPIAERIKWAAKNQDLSRPNCGSLCNRYDSSIMKFVRFIFSISGFPAGISRKKLNWAYNTAKNPFWLRTVLAILKISHKILGKEIVFEIRIRK